MSAHTVNNQDKLRLTPDQLEAIMSIVKRGVMGAVENISDRITKLAAITVLFHRLAADLLGKFG